MKDDKLLKNSSEYSTVARVADSGAYACMVEIKGIVKKSDPVWIRVHGELILRRTKHLLLGKLELMICRMCVRCQAALTTLQ